MVEIWSDIQGFEGLYQVSTKGRVKSLARYKKNHSKMEYIPERIKKARKDTQGYLLVDLYKDNKSTTIRVHRLVAMAFIDNKDNKKTVNHIDGNKENNQVDNLEWLTNAEQNIHMYKTKLKTNIDKCIKAMNKANSKKVKCLNDGKIYNSAVAVSRAYGISDSFVRMICKGKRTSKRGLMFAYI